MSYTLSTSMIMSLYGGYYGQMTVPSMPSYGGYGVYGTGYISVSEPSMEPLMVVEERDLEYTLAPAPEPVNVPLEQYELLTLEPSPEDTVQVDLLSIDDKETLSQEEYEQLIEENDKEDLDIDEVEGVYLELVNEARQTSVQEKSFPSESDDEDSAKSSSMIYSVIGVIAIIALNM